MPSKVRPIPLIERDEDGVLFAQVPSLPGCHTQGRTLAEVEERIQEAIKLYLEVAADRGQVIADTQLVGVHEVVVA